MNARTCLLYSASLVRLLAAFEALLQEGYDRVTYQGLVKVLPVSTTAIKTVVHEAQKKGLVECVHLGNGRGQKSLFRLSAEGRKVLQ